MATESGPVSVTTPPICVIGAGTMGRGIAQVALAAGHVVTLVDPDRAQLDGAREDITGRLSRRLDGAAQLVHDRLTLASDITAAPPDPATVVIEAVIENAAVKQQVFNDALDHFGDACVLATNTSSLSITEIAAGTRVPSRVVGMHFFNPVPAMKLVEVVHGLQTDPTLVGVIAELATSWGKQVATVRSAPGFIVNRVARSFYGEALRLLEEGVAPVETIDAVMRSAGQFRMGPFELMDLIGVEINFAVTKTVWASYNFDPRFAPSQTQAELVAGGRFGRKTGHGFYSYVDGARQTPDSTADSGQRSPERTSAPSGVITGKIVLRGRSPQLEALLDRAGFHADQPRPVDAQPRLELPGIGAIVVTRGLTAQQEAVALGTEVAVLDRCLEPTSASGVALAATDEAISEAAVALLLRAGLSAYPISDTPGLIVARILAMIANEAWEAVSQQVATPTDVDTAMVLGTNYPSGPFGWCEEWGLKTVLAILDALSDDYRDPRYRASQRLRSTARTTAIRRAG